MNKKTTVWLSLLVLVFLLVGCGMDTSRLTKPVQDDADKLIKVQIYFTDDQNITCYVKSLGIEQDAKVYVGGSSASYMYDSQGRIVGSYNYQRVLYMKILPEESK